MNQEVRSGSPDLFLIRNQTPSGLAGRRVVVTRAPHQAAEVVDLLGEQGAKALHYPCIDILPPEDTSELDTILREAADGAFDWLVLTSANTAWILGQRLKALDLAFEGALVAAVGPKTAAAVWTELNLVVDLVAERHVAEELAEALQPVGGQRILLPQSAIARGVLAEALRKAGADVTVVTAYTTAPGQGGNAVPQLLREGSVDAITFSSSSTVRYFLSRLEAEDGRRDDLKGVCLAAIGPITAETMREHDLPVSVQAAEFTLLGLVKALDIYFAERIDE